MLKWIEWLFSGVGVTLLVLVMKWLLGRKKTHQQPRPSEQTLKNQLPANEESPKQRCPDERSITPKDIRDAIDATPLFRQEDVCKDFIGTRIVASGEILSVREEDKNLLYVYVKSTGSMYLQSHVRQEDYPYLKTLRKEAYIRIEGRIKDVQYKTEIVVSIMKLEIVEASDVCD